MALIDKGVFVRQMGAIDTHVKPCTVTSTMLPAVFAPTPMTWPNGETGEVQLQSYAAMNRTELLEGPLMAAILSATSPPTAG